MTIVLPATVIIRVTELADMLETDLKTVISYLYLTKINVMKISSHNKSWLVLIEDLK